MYLSPISYQTNVMNKQSVNFQANPIEKKLINASSKELKENMLKMGTGLAAMAAGGKALINMQNSDKTEEIAETEENVKPIETEEEHDARIKKLEKIGRDKAKELEEKGIIADANSCVLNCLATIEAPDGTFEKIVNDFVDLHNSVTNPEMITKEFIDDFINKLEEKYNISSIKDDNGAVAKIRIMQLLKNNWIYGKEVYLAEGTPLNEIRRDVMQHRMKPNEKILEMRRLLTPKDGAWAIDENYHSYSLNADGEKIRYGRNGSMYIHRGEPGGIEQFIYKEQYYGDFTEVLKMPGSVVETLYDYYGIPKKTETIEEVDGGVIKTTTEYLGDGSIKSKKKTIEFDDFKTTNSYN